MSDKETETPPSPELIEAMNERTKEFIKHRKWMDEQTWECHSCGNITVGLMSCCGYPTKSLVRDAKKTDS